MGMQYYPVLPPRPRKERPPGFNSDKSRTVSQKITYRYDHYDWYLHIPTGNATLVDDTHKDKESGAIATKTFSRNKDWKQIVARHGDATYNYARTDGSILPAHVTGQGRSTAGNYQYVFRGNCVGDLLIDGGDHPVTKDIALARLKGKLSDHIGGNALLPPLAESKELHRLVGSLSWITAAHLEELIAIKKGRGKRALKLAAQLWLTYSFGVKPLLSDIQRTADAIDAYTGRIDHRARVTGSKSEEWYSNSKFPRAMDFSNATVDIISVAKHKISYRYIACAKLQVFSTESYTLARHLGLDLSSIPSALWELTGYSWLIDYFSTVGAWLEDYFYTLPGAIEYCMLNTRYELKVDMLAKLRPIVPTDSVSGSVWPGRFEYFSFNRQKLSSLPYRGLRVKSVDEIGRRALNKVLNLASVYANFLK